jgi:hypothetical protein
MGVRGCVLTIRRLAEVMMKVKVTLDRLPVQTESKVRCRCRTLAHGRIHADGARSRPRHHLGVVIRIRGHPDGWRRLGPLPRLAADHALARELCFDLSLVRLLGLLVLRNCRGLSTCVCVTERGNPI